MIFFAGTFSGYPLPRYYTKAERKKIHDDSLKIADSLRVADSIRIADSTRIADSCMIVRYHVSDKIRIKEKRQKTEEKRRAEELKKTILLTEDTSGPIVPGAVDNISARTIVINPDNPYAKEIDSLQLKIDSLNNCIYESDSRFRDMKTFALSEKKRYMLFLLDNKIKDTSAILTCCNKLFEVYTLRYDLMLAIRKSQDDNTKSFIQFHIEEHQRKMVELSNFLISLSPEVPFYPGRNLQESVTKE